MKTKNLIYELIETFIVSFIALVLIYVTVAIPEKVEGPSMEPSFYTGERVLVDRLSFKFKDYERGDIIVLNPPNASGSYIKRIIGVPGDYLKIYDCEVYISKDKEQFKLEEPYLFENTCTSAGARIQEGRALYLEKDTYFVLGDNRNHSADSRTFGVIKKNDILGKVIFRFWPIDKITLY